MEATGIYGKTIANFLYLQNYEVSIIPSCISAFAKSKLSRHTDKVDSMLIAEYASKHALLLYTPKDKIQQELQDLYRCLQNLKYQLNQTQNYLENKDHLSSLVCNSYNQLDSINKRIVKAKKDGIMKLKRKK